MFVCLFVCSGLFTPLCWLHTNAQTQVVPHLLIVCAVEMLKEKLDRHPPLDLAGNQLQMDLSVEPPDVEELVKLVTMATAMLASRTGYSYVYKCERGSGNEWEGQWGEVGEAIGGGGGGGRDSGTR